MTEALLIVLLLGSMYLTARLYPKPPRYIRDGKSEVFWVPPLVTHGVDLTPFVKGFKDFDDTIQGVNQAFSETSKTMSLFQNTFEATITGTWNTDSDLEGTEITITDHTYDEATGLLQMKFKHEKPWNDRYCHSREHYYSDEDLRGNPCAVCFDDKDWCPICGVYWESILYPGPEGV